MASKNVCDHLWAITNVKAAVRQECEECVKTGADWVHLRTCHRYGVTICCDSSPNQHASKHAHASGHPVIASSQPGNARCNAIATRRWRGISWRALSLPPWPRSCPTVFAARLQSYYVDVTHLQANKGEVVLTSATMFHLDPREIATAGDMPNDTSMFEKSGLSIALGPRHMSRPHPKKKVLRTRSSDLFSLAHD